MHRIIFSVETKQFGPTDPIQLMVGYADKWLPLDLMGSRHGLRAVHDLPDDVSSCTLVMEATGPAYGRVKVFALIPSGSRLGPIVEKWISADEANIAVRAKGVVNLW